MPPRRHPSYESFLFVIKDLLVQDGVDELAAQIHGHKVADSIWRVYKAVGDSSTPKTASFIAENVMSMYKELYERTFPGVA